MPACSLPTCKSNSQKGFKLFRVPKNKNQSDEWLKFMQENNLINFNENSRLCELHFLWVQTEEGLVRSSVPTIAPIEDDLEVRIKLKRSRKT